MNPDESNRAKNSATSEKLGLRVLLAEDNPTNQTVGRAMLERLGCQVQIAPGGRECVAAATSARFDAVLMDCQMPDVDGYDATRLIREWERAAGTGHRLPIIALTGNAMTGDRERCLAAGMDHYLAKPFNMADLQSVLRSIRPAQSASQAHGGDPDMSAARPSVPVLDESRIAELLDIGGTELVQRSVQLFSSTTRDKLNELQAQIAAGDLDALARGAHFLKSSSANLGLQRFAAVAADFEKRAKSGDSSITACFAKEFDDALEQAMSALVTAGHFHP